MDEIRARICGNDTETECFFPLAAAQYLVKDSEIVFLQLRIICAALFIIYAASHGAIQRPHSAAPRQKSKDENGSSGANNNEDKTHQYAQSLMPSDIIMFPFFAGTALVSLYYLIKLLDDPELLNKVFRWWLGASGLVSAIVFYRHAIHLVSNFLLPSFWTDWSGKIYAVRPQSHSVYMCDPSASGDGLVTKTWQKMPLSTLPVPYHVPGAAPRKIASWLTWELLNCFHDKWTLVVNLPGSWSVPVKAKFTLASLLAVAAAVVVAISHAFTTPGTFTTYATNVSGTAMSYGMILMMSPTSFPIGSAVLLGLCAYDIVMVFYTPFMITVAQTIDAPIKLTFASKNGASILGLGDIILPGMLIAMCLRFDLYRHYQSKVTSKTVTLETTLESGSQGGEPVVRKAKAEMVHKAEYIDPSGHWGDWFWLRGKGQVLKETLYQKTYFHAAMVGYALGMLTTMAVLTMFKKGQPALLYLVPGVLSMVWATAAVRGELGLLWSYTEDGSLDTEDTVVTTTKIAETATSKSQQEPNKNAESSTSANPTQAFADTGGKAQRESDTVYDEWKEDLSFSEYMSDDESDKIDFLKDVLFSIAIVHPKRLRQTKQKTEKPLVGKLEKAEKVE